MARVVRLVSDVTGTEAPEADFQSCVIRTHPAVTAAKSLDFLDGELDTLKEATNLVVLEFNGGAEKREVVVTHADFKKLVPDKVVVAAAFTRGRKRGSTVTPSSNGDTPEPA